jgi:hypothetical protein
MRLFRPIVAMRMFQLDAISSSSSSSVSAIFREIRGIEAPSVARVWRAESGEVTVP